MIESINSSDISHKVIKLSSSFAMLISWSSKCCKDKNIICCYLYSLVANVTFFQADIFIYLLIIMIIFFIIITII